MAKDGEYCINILTQISAADKALKSVALLLLEDHLTHCIKEASLEGGEVAGETHIPAPATHNATHAAQR